MFTVLTWWHLHDAILIDHVGRQQQVTGVTGMMIYTVLRHVVAMRVT